jgi:hypothetical protein
LRFFLPVLFTGFFYRFVDLISGRHHHRPQSLA